MTSFPISPLFDAYMNPKINRYHLLHKQSDIKICSFTFSIILASYYPNEFIYPTSRDMNTLIIREQPGRPFTESSFSHFFFSIFSNTFDLYLYILISSLPLLQGDNVPLIPGSYIFHLTFLFCYSD